MSIWVASTVDGVCHTSVKIEAGLSATSRFWRNEADVRDAADVLTSAKLGRVS